MTLDVLLIAVGALGVVVAALSARIRRLPLSEPLLALVVGVLLGPEVLAALPLPPITAEHGVVHDATRVLLVISVIGVALRYPFGSVSSQLRPVVILLLVALPAMALVSTGLTTGILGVTLGAALMLGTAICPTDPVLASSVVTGRPAEEDLPSRDRQILSLESGANDGLALPFVLAAVALAGPMTAGEAVVEVLWQVLGAVTLGVLAGWLGGRALRAGENHGATSHGPMLLFTVLLALLVLGLSGVLHLDGVLAAFVAGLAFNLTSTGSERTADLEIDEAVNRFAVLPMFVLLGATIPWTVWHELGWAGILLSLAVLLLRRIPVLLLLKRPLRLGWPDALYLGWFGPVGVSAVFYLTLEAQELDLPDIVLGAGIMIVVASTVAHGLTSTAGRLLYRRLTNETTAGQEHQASGRGARAKIGDMAIDPRGADLKRYLQEDPGGPVVMLNLLRFAEGGRDLYDQYARALETTFLPRYGGEVLFAGDGSTSLVAETGQSWDAVLLVRYPSRDAFTRMVADPEYQEVTDLRSRALTEAVLQSTTPWA